MRIETYETKTRRLIEKARHQADTGCVGPAAETIREALAMARQGSRMAGDLKVRLDDIAIEARDAAAELHRRAAR